METSFPPPALLAHQLLQVYLRPSVFSPSNPIYSRTVHFPIGTSLISYISIVTDGNPTIIEAVFSTYNWSDMDTSSTIKSNGYLILKVLFSVIDVFLTSTPMLAKYYFVSHPWQLMSNRVPTSLFINIPAKICWQFWGEASRRLASFVTLAYVSRQASLFCPCLPASYWFPCFITLKVPNLDWDCYHSALFFRTSKISLC